MVATSKTVTGNIKGAPLYVEHWDGRRYRFFMLHHHSGDWTTPEKVSGSLPYTKCVDFTRDPDEVRKKLESARNGDPPEK